MFRKLGDALRRFMYGRYGTDMLNKWLLIAGIALMLMGNLGSKYLASWLSMLNLIAYIPLVWGIFRMYSRNIDARRRENAGFMRLRNRLFDRQNRYFSCPRCKQVVRVPRGKGTISIRCPKCRESFIKKT